MVTVINRESKAILARLLANENVNVHFERGLETAYFDLEKRKVGIPIYKKSTPVEVVDMFIGHETGHALFTPELPSEAIKKVKPLLNNPKVSDETIHGFLNIVEDARIERFQKNKYPGLRQDFIKGYKWALDNKMFGEDLNSGKLIDRLNVYCKAGHDSGVTFKDGVEKDFLNDMNNTKSWSDVIDLTARLLNYELKEMPPSMKLLEVPVSVSKFEIARSSMVDKDAKEIQYLELPDISTKFSKNTIEDKLIQDYKIVLSDYRNLYGNRRKQAVVDFRKETQKEISFMVKEFEMRKAAEEYARAQIYKTGKLNMNKVFSADYNDDIFLKKVVVNQGKNHGFLMILDWSGSMGNNLHSTFKQMLSMIFFCQKVQIPFEIYLFKNSDGPALLEGAKDMRVCLRNIFSSRMSIFEFNEMLGYFWTVSNDGGSSIDPLGNTPLNSSIILTPYLIERFLKQYKVNILNLIYLTDGSATDAISGKIPILVDAKNHNQYDFGNTGLTDSLLKWVKHKHPEINSVGFFITNHYQDSDIFKDNPNSWKTWSNDGYLIDKKSGYDFYFHMSVDEYNNGLTNKPAFDRKKRVMLRKFIEIIATPAKDKK